MNWTYTVIPLAISRWTSIIVILLLLTLHGNARSETPAPPRRIAVVLVQVEQSDPQLTAFRSGLAEAGYVEGRDVVLDWYSVESDYSRLPAVLSKALATRPDLFFLENATAARALAPLTTDIPIVVALMGDPIGSGVVKSLAHPEGNITGTSMMLTDIMARRLQLLKEVMPKLSRVGVLKDAGVPIHNAWVEHLTDAGKILGITLSVAAVSKSNDLASAYSGLRKQGAQAVFVLDSGFLASLRDELIARADKDRIPVTFGARRWVEQGALLSYSPSFHWMFHRSAYYVDRIFKGKKPSELPIEQPTKFELAVNEKVARKLGLKIPESIYVQATHVFK